MELTAQEITINKIKNNINNMEGYYYKNNTDLMFEELDKALFDLNCLKYFQSNHPDLCGV